ncbi:MAG: 50S ribosomal protein L1 [Candidatus Ancillula sp.]|jgi:large subunit ribosomal protein L1|nr:50S ribosomal protein L1 [Candidatus Ancillula sp.]
MVRRSKKWKVAAELINRDRAYDINEALELLKNASNRKFDETVEVVFRLNVDPRKADQAVRGTVNLPNGTGKTARVVVIAQADAAKSAQDAGADEVGSDELIDKIFKGYTDFDALVATPDMMVKVGKLGRVLGPRGLMPNPKLGTVTMDTAKAVGDIKGGKIEFRVDKNSNLAFIIGKASFSVEKLAQNFAAAADEILRARPSTIKGRYITKGTISTTMGPGVPLNLLTIL